MRRKFPSELRFDKISKDWVVIATGRGKRPTNFKKHKSRTKQPKKNCPFCGIEKKEQPVLVFFQGKEVNLNSQQWTTLVIPNKYPAFLPANKLNREKRGSFYEKMDAVGFHEVVITKDHDKHLGKLNKEKAKEVFDVFQKRYLKLSKEKLVNHISIFHNHGPQAGASIYHPHSQIITTPLVDIDLKKALKNSQKYFQKQKKCIYCQMNKWEEKNKERIVFENKDFLALCPFASKTAFQVIVSPKKHHSYFEKASEKEKESLAEAFQAVLKKIDKGLNSPDYNFYLHSAPCDGNKHDYYHYHWTILPKTSTWAGFEIGTQMEISTIEPEKAASYLRKQ